MALMKKLDLETARKKFINGADGIKVDRRKTNKSEWQNILLRIKVEAIHKIDTLVDSRMGMTRTSWILEAIQEKMKREEKLTKN